jgi:hypothetical protein
MHPHESSAIDSGPLAPHHFGSGAWEAAYDDRSETTVRESTQPAAEDPFAMFLARGPRARQGGLGRSPGRFA